MRSLWAAATVMPLFAACGDPPPPEGPGADDCAIDITLSGRINDHVSGPQYCRATGTYDSPAPRAKSWMDGPHGDFGVELFDVSEGQLGTFKATLSISRNSTPPGGWITAPATCDITISEWRFQYDVADGASFFYLGAGTCNSAAKAYGKEDGEIALSDFSLKNWIIWSR